MKVPVLLLLALLAGRAPAQERRVPVAVDYLAGSDVYVALGSRAGLAEGDTLAAYPGASGERRGMLLARVVTVRRTVLSFVGARFDVAVGDTLWLGLLRPPPVEAKAPRGEPQTEQGRHAVTDAPRSPARTGQAPQLDGQLALELDALQTTLAAGDARHYTTPTFRLHAMASDLPGGLRMAANLRASRWPAPGGHSAVVLRAYEANIEKTFATLPLRLQAGRFSTPLEPYGGYWDGLLARVGGERFGIGAATGFLPRRADEGFSTDVVRASAFADYHARGDALRYDAVLGLHALRPRDAFADQTFVGLSQRLRWRELLLSQSLQIDREVDGSWLVSGVQLAAALPISRGLVARTGLSRFRPAELDGESPLPTFQRDRGSFGLGWYGGWLSLNADVTATRRADGRTTSGYTALLFVPRTLAGFGVSASASRSDSDIFRSSLLMGELSRRVGNLHARLGLRTTRFEGLVAAEQNTGADLTLNIPLSGRTRLLLRSESWWGDAAGSRQRLFTSLTTGF